MNSLKRLQCLTEMLKSSFLWQSSIRQFHVCPAVNASFDPEIDSLGRFDPEIRQKKRKLRFLEYNKIIYPPQKPEEPRRPAEFFYLSGELDLSVKKLFHHIYMIRGLSIDDAMKKLSFKPHKSAQLISQCLEDAQKEAVEEHNVEYPSNLWIEHAWAGKFYIVKYYKIQGKPRERVRYYSKLFVILREGTPPKVYYEPQQSGYEMMEEYLKKQRQRKIVNSL